MTVFWEIMVRAFQRQITYRAAALAGLATNLFFGFIKAAMVEAYYQNTQILSGMDVKAAVTYTVVTQALLGFLSIFGTFDLMRTIYRGEVATDLLKPISFLGLWMARDFGQSVAQLLLRGSVILLVYGLFMDMGFPESPMQWIYTVVSLLLGWTVWFVVRFLVNLGAFWSPDARGIARLCYAFTLLLSGLLMPIRLYPEWVQKFAAWTPFPYVLNTPMEIYSGVLSSQEMLHALVLQGIWLVALLILTQGVWQQASKRLMVLGG
ncbi:ABC transporter permease [Deinococcus roseus]|uniref:ABC transporter permease n=1 Tax=Deinococcus roseus TaxID=392414 RepID=A0ABQ2D7E9_9DEIO|nr:ABC-2 family transporter protein [Deinococcus roseus]GGJ48544.1 ABC transporter permease [Deinococcus roseus]